MVCRTERAAAGSAAATWAKRSDACGSQASCWMRLSKKGLTARIAGCQLVEPLHCQVGLGLSPLAEGAAAGANPQALRQATGPVQGAAGIGPGHRARQIIVG